MNIETACHIILGDALAHSIINDMGVHWAVIAAMTKAQTTDSPAALKAIRDYNKREALLPPGQKGEPTDRNP